MLARDGYDESLTIFCIFTQSRLEKANEVRRLSRDFRRDIGTHHLEARRREHRLLSSQHIEQQGRRLVQLHILRFFGDQTSFPYQCLRDLQNSGKRDCRNTYSRNSEDFVSVNYAYISDSRDFDYSALRKGGQSPIYDLIKVYILTRKKRRDATLRLLSGRFVLYMFPQILHHLHNSLI